MKKTLFAACVAMTTAVHCTDKTATAPKTNPPAPVVTTISPPQGAPEPVALEVEDPLAITHEHPHKVNHLARVEELSARGEMADALTEARRALFDDPSDEDALEAIVRMAKATRERQLTVLALEKLAMLRPDDAEPLIQKARMLLQLKDVEGALQAAREALGRDAEHPSAHHAMGRAYLEAGELQSAIDSFKETLELEPEHGFALNNLGFAYLRAGKNEEALDVLTRAAELLPHVAFVHNNLGVALERQGRMTEAKLSFAQATSLSPKYVKAIVNTERLRKVAQADIRTQEPSAAGQAPVEPSTLGEDEAQ